MNWFTNNVVPYLGWIVCVGIVIACIVLKRKFDSHNDAFRTKERKGWHFHKAKVVSLDEYRKHRRAK